MKRNYLLLIIMMLIPMVGWAENQGYAVFDESTGVLTFMYGEKPSGDHVYLTDHTPIDRDGISEWLEEGWLAYKNELKKVVFEPSFKDARPISGSFWFYQCANLTEISGLDNLNTSEMKSMLAMFSGCIVLQIIDVSHFDTRNVGNMQAMFSDCKSLKELDCSSFNTSNVKQMHQMFYNCLQLERLNIDNFDTGNVNTMRAMFCQCAKLKSINVGSFDTGKVKGMSSMFRFCESLEEIDLSNFNTTQVTDMDIMFGECYQLKKLDLSNFKTDNLTSMLAMFECCENLEVADLSNFNTSLVTDMNHLFSGCYNLKEVDIRHFSTNENTDMTKMINTVQTIILGPSFNTGHMEGKELSIAAQNVKFVGDVPSSMKSNLFKGSSGLLYVPEQYESNFASKYVGGKFYEGSLTLTTYTLDEKGGETTPVEPSTPNVGSRLMKSFTWTDGKDSEVVEMKYDDKGRLTEYDVVGKLLYGISYKDNSISIKEKSNSNYSDTYDYTISDGRIVSGKSFLDADYVDIDRTFTYNSKAQLVSIVNKEKERGYSEVYTTKESWEWSGSNLSSWNEKDEEDTESSVFTYNSLTAEPVIRAMFGFSQLRYPEHFFEIVAIYPYLGSLPQNLFEKIKHHDAEGRDFEYLYGYQQNADGDITQVTIDNKDKSYVFTFEWADSGSQPSGIQDLVDKAYLSDDYYNMYGVRVTQPRKGVYIHHGRKVVVK